MYYCEEEKDVRYVDFIRDTNVYEAMPVPSNQTKNEGINTALAGTRRSYDIDVLLDDIKNFIKINRLRVGEYFKDFDPLRKGIIPENKFAGVISQMKIDLDDKQIELLRKRYLLPNDSSKVNYDKFLS
jgi:Ca2+-binding EF-hand superfamily protein